MLRTFAGFAKKARGMANEFQSQFTDAMRDADMDDVRKTISDVRSLNPKNALKDAFDPIRKAGEDVKREMQGVKTGVENSIAPSAPMMAAPSPEPTVAPIVAPAPSVVLPSTAPAELAPVVVAKAKATPKKAATNKQPVAKLEQVVKLPSAKKPRAKKTEVKA